MSIIFGIFAFYIGLFPYIVLRHQSIETTDFSGRDSLLLGIGTALILFYGAELFLYEKLREIFYISVICLGILFFNGAYMDYQDNYYQQLRFQSEVRHNEILQNAKNILYLATIPTYSAPGMNGNSYIASGKLDKYYIDGIEALGGLPVEENRFAFVQTNMTDYDVSHSDLDAIVYIDNEVIPAKDILKHKVEELRGSEQFDEWIDESRRISVYSVSKRQSDAILTAFQDGELTEYNIYTYLVENGSTK